MPSKAILLEEVLFAEYKDKPYGSSNDFRRIVYKDHKVYLKTSDLYKRILNYQLKTYGHVLGKGDVIDEIPKYNFTRNPNIRRQNIENATNQEKLEALERRAERRGSNGKGKNQSKGNKNINIR